MDNKQMKLERQGIYKTIPDYLDDPLIFYDKATRRLMLLAYWNSKMWLFFRGANDNWVTQREATDDDLQKLNNLTNSMLIEVDALANPGG